MPPSFTRLESFSSQFIPARHVDIWFPESYTSNPQRRYPVVYMHDGQNLFDPQLAYGGVDWGVVPAMQKLAAAGEAREAIIVGVWNSDRRFHEYQPWRPFIETPRGQAVYAKHQKEMGEIFSDDYLKFLVEELKPTIDLQYRTLPGPGDTVVMGSSMGGLISLYAICEYPQVFGGAGCVSTHWPVVRQLMINYMKLHLPDPQTHKIYFDFGTEGLDAQYETYQLKADKVMIKKKYKADIHWMTRKFEGATHHESAWRERVHIPLVFLLGK
ncbi:MAG: esterase [Chloroflexi bacterium HGW-Chloroflexi-10]|nr:MAG: esterase [Chloroflexi bacterium HGW-Chloroflexi-10]